MTIANEYYALLHRGVMHYVLDKIKRYQLRRYYVMLIVNCMAIKYLSIFTVSHLV